MERLKNLFVAIIATLVGRWVEGKIQIKENWTSASKSLVEAKDQIKKNWVAATVVAVLTVGLIVIMVVLPTCKRVDSCIRWYAWSPGLIAQHFVGDAFIQLPYILIPISLIKIRRDSDLPLNYIFFLSGAFVVLCGFTHGSNILTTFWPYYWAQGNLKMLTAAVSMGTWVVLEYKVRPVMRTLPKYGEILAGQKALEYANNELANINEALAAQKTALESANAGLKTAQAALQTANTQLEAKAAELATSNEALAAQKTALESANAGLKTAQAALQTANEQLEAKAAELASANETLVNQAAALQRANQTAEQNRADAETKASQLASANEALAQQKTALESANAGLKTAQAALQTANEQLEAKAAELASANETLAQQKTALESANAQLLQLQGELETKAVELQQESVEARGERDRLQGLLDKIRAQELTIHELSVVILEIEPGRILVPVIGLLDSDRTGQLMQAVTERITAAKAHSVILDIAGVDVVDTGVADHLLKVEKVIGLMGSQCIITGIRAAVAQTLVQLGAILPRYTRASLYAGIQLARRLRRQ